MIKLALVLLLAAPLHAKPRAPLPGADELILKMLTGPETSYVAVERVQVFAPGKKPKAMTVNIKAAPGGKIRRETAGRKKKPGPIELYVEDEPAGKRLARLRSLYELTVSTGGVVAKRKTWKLELRLKTSVVLRRALWVSRDEGLLMKRETYRDDGTLARRERLTKLELPAAVDAALFAGVAPKKPWTPSGVVLAGEKDGTRTYTNGLESYTVKDGRVSGDLAEDDAARAAGR
ncbi:MAG: hypothetical protein HY923_06445 [Elusimicrobia bacterium]|nr:hypothetical protein [Elusimicrobiota bacterium]